MHPRVVSATYARAKGWQITDIVNDINATLLKTSKEKLSEDNFYAIIKRTREVDEGKRGTVRKSALTDAIDQWFYQHGCWVPNLDVSLREHTDEINRIMTVLEENPELITLDRLTCLILALHGAWRKIHEIADAAGLTTDPVADALRDFNQAN